MNVKFADISAGQFDFEVQIHLACGNYVFIKFLFAFKNERKYLKTKIK